MKGKDIKEEELFDSIFRESLKDASEPVSDAVWASLAGRLDASGSLVRRRTIFRKVAGYAAAFSAAAALALAVLLPGRGVKEVTDDAISVIPSDNLVAQEIQVPESTATPADVVPSSVTYIPPVPQENVPDKVHEEIQASSQEIPQEQQPNISQTENRAGQDVPRNVEAGDLWDDILEEEEESSKVRVSVDLFGDAFHGASSDKSAVTRMKAPRANFSSKSTVSESSGSQFALPLTFGLGTKISLNERWALGTGISYSYLSRTFDGNYIKVDESGNVILNKNFEDIRNSQHYLGIPLNVYYNILNFKRFNFYAYAGGMVEKCLSNKFIMGAGGDRIKFKGGTSGVQLSVLGGLGIEYGLNDFMGIYLDPNVRYYFDMNQPKSIRTQQPLNIGFELGLRFNL